MLLCQSICNKWERLKFKQCTPYWPRVKRLLDPYQILVSVSVKTSMQIDKKRTIAACTIWVPALSAERELLLGRTATSLQRYHVPIPTWALARFQNNGWRSQGMNTCLALQPQLLEMRLRHQKHQILPDSFSPDHCLLIVEAMRHDLER